MGHLQLPATAANRRRHRHPRLRRASVYLAAAKASSSLHEKATGFPNDALVSYIQASQHEADCPAKAD